jgi:hypothetical protein
MNDDDCPFSYGPGEPPPIVHKVIGVCVYCKGDAYTFDKYHRMCCFICAISNEM